MSPRRRVCAAVPRAAWPRGRSARRPRRRPRVAARLRESLARAWDAANEETAVAELNTLLAGANAQPWLERREGGSRFRYDRPGTPVRKFADALAARALLEEIAAGRWSRFGRCDAGPCRCVFIDRTRSGVRRYCCRLCADRAAHQAFRRRQARP